MTLRDLCRAVHQRAKREDFDKKDVLRLVSEAMKAERRLHAERLRHRAEREILRNEINHEKVLIEAGVARAEDRQRAIYESAQASSGSLDALARGKTLSFNAEAALLRAAPTHGLTANLDCRRLSNAKNVD